MTARLQRRASPTPRSFIVATENRDSAPLREQNPGLRFIPVRHMAMCRLMKMITLPKLRNGASVVRVPPEVAERARIPIEPMAGIS